MAASPAAARVRPATAADFTAVAALLGELGRPALTPDTTDSARRVYERQLARPETAAHVAEIDGVVVGFMSCELRERLNRTQLQAWIPDLIVTAPHRGRGIGKALLSRAIATAQAQGCWSMTLESGRSRHAAHQLYRSLGLVAEGEYFIRYL